MEVIWLLGSPFSVLIFSKCKRLPGLMTVLAIDIWAFVINKQVDIFRINNLEKRPPLRTAGFSLLISGFLKILLIALSQIIFQPA
jgi:hypothetical protein